MNPPNTHVKAHAQVLLAQRVRMMPPLNFSQDGRGKSVCNICLDDIRHDDILSMPPCRHVVHHACISTWETQCALSRQCPKCVVCNQNYNMKIMCSARVLGIPEDTFSRFQSALIRSVHAAVYAIGLFTLAIVFLLLFARLHSTESPIM